MTDAREDAEANAGHTPTVGEITPPELPEWIEIPEWANNAPAGQWLRTWIVPEALRRGYKAVWLRATAGETFYLPPVRLTPESLEVNLTLREPTAHTIGDTVRSADVDWNVFPQNNAGHLLLDAVEVRWGEGEWRVLFNAEVDLAVFEWEDKLTQLCAKYPGVRLPVQPDGSIAPEVILPEELRAHADARPVFDHGFIKWRLDHGVQYVYNTPEALRQAAGLSRYAFDGPRSEVTPKEGILLIAEGKLHLRLATAEDTLPEKRTYKLSATLDAEALGELLERTGGGQSDLTQEEAAELTDTLVLTCSEPDKLSMTLTDPATGGSLLTDPATGDALPAATLREFRFRISTKLTLTPDGIAFEIGGQYVLLVPDPVDEWEKWYTPDKTLEDLVAYSHEGEEMETTPADDTAAPETTAPPPLPQGGKLPDNVPQYTSEEMRVLSYAMADAPTLRHWLPAPRDSDLEVLAMLYKRPGERFEIKFDPGALTDDLKTGLRLDTTDAMAEFLRQCGFKGVLVLHQMGMAAILKTDEPMALDYFVNSVFDPRTTKARAEYRARTWDIIRTALAMRLFGARAGVYRDPKTKKPIDLIFRGEPFIALSPGARKFAKGQQPLWPNAEIPVTVGFTMGAWGKQAQRNPAILAYFGSFDKVLAISAGKPAGAWAQCILFNLQQKWREGAKAVVVRKRTSTYASGDDHERLSTRWPHAFTRRQLLWDLCPPDQAFSVMDILHGPNPSRAKRYWNDAIKILKDQGAITYYAELAPLPTDADGKPKRRGSADAWLDQPLDIRPNAEGQAAAREIKTAYRKALSSRPRRKPKGNGKEAPAAGGEGTAETPQEGNPS